MCYNRKKMVDKLHEVILIIKMKGVKVNLNFKTRVVNCTFINDELSKLLYTPS